MESAEKHFGSQNDLAAILPIHMRPHHRDTADQAHGIALWLQDCHTSNNYGQDQASSGLIIRTNDPFGWSLAIMDHSKDVPHNCATDFTSNTDLIDNSLNLKWQDSSYQSFYEDQREQSDTEDVIYEGVPVFTNWSDFTKQLDATELSANLSLEKLNDHTVNKEIDKPKRVSRNSRSRNNIVTSPYSATLLDHPEGIYKYVNIYDANSSATRNQAYYRIRAKLTPELAQMLESDDEEKVNNAVYQLDRRQGDKKIDYKEERVLRKRLTLHLSRYGKRYSQGVLYYALPLFPASRIPELLSQDEEIFKNAAQDLVNCYKQAKRKYKQNDVNDGENGTDQVRETAT